MTSELQTKLLKDFNAEARSMGHDEFHVGQMTWVFLTWLKKIQGYCIKRDNDGHSYLVPDKDAEDFDKWLALECESDDFQEQYDKFWSMSIGGRGPEKLYVFE